MYGRKNRYIHDQLLENYFINDSNYFQYSINQIITFMEKNKERQDMLMGRNKNQAKEQVTTKDHYSNKDVCKSFLICFCFNTLFANTVYDEGMCDKRHDPYLKKIFDSDTLRSEYERTYLNECINWIEKRLSQVENRIKKNQALLQNKSNQPQKICEICGAIQTINDTDKKIQTHLQGKIHQGFLRLRHEIQTLKIRLDILINLERGKDQKQKSLKQMLG